MDLDRKIVLNIMVTSVFAWLLKNIQKYTKNLYFDLNFGNHIKLDIPFFLILIYVIFFPGNISFFFWIKGVGLIGANRAGVYLHLMPILGAVMAMIIFKEKIMFYHFIGAIFIISGIVLSNKKKLNA